MPRVTRRDCEGAVNRLVRIVGKELVIEYSGAPQRPRLALRTATYNSNDRRICDVFERWVSPRLSTGAFYEWVWAAIAGIELYWHNG